MSDSLNKAIEKLPDIWFDWYARLLPGCFGVALYLYLSSEIPSTPTTPHVFLFLFFGYGLGHILQPLSSCLVKYWEKKRFGNEEKYERAKADDSVSESSRNKVSKAHAEANSMLSFALALILNMVHFWLSPKLNNFWFWFWFWPSVSLVYFLVMAIERTYARNRKINDIYPNEDDKSKPGT